MSTKASAFQWDDPLLFNEQLTEEERMIQDSVRSFAQTELQPRVTKAFASEAFDPAIMREMATFESASVATKA